MIALWDAGELQNGVSSYELHRYGQDGQKAAWFVLQRLRHIFEMRL